MPNPRDGLAVMVPPGVGNVETDDSMGKPVADDSPRLLDCKMDFSWAHWVHPGDVHVDER